MNNSTPNCDLNNSSNLYAPPPVAHTGGQKGGHVAGNAASHDGAGAEDDDAAECGDAEAAVVEFVVA